MSRLPRIISDDEKEKICQAYVGGKSINFLSKEHRKQKWQIKEILEEFKIKILNSYEKKKELAFLEEKNYFDQLDPLQSYVLGLIFGDGCVHYNPTKYKYALTITSNDLDVLESGRQLFGTQFKIKKRKTSNAYNLVINSKHLCEELINKFKLQSPKSNNLVWPTLPTDMYSVFISGLLSTDGCVRLDQRRLGKNSALEFSYSSNCLEFVEKLQQYLTNTLNVSQTKIKQNKTNRKNINYSLRYSGTQAKQILDWIYDPTNELTRCQRKFNIYQNYLTSVSNSII